MTELSSAPAAPPVTPASTTPVEPPGAAPRASRPAKPSRPLLSILARGIALFVSIFSLLGIAIEYTSLFHYDPNLWWISFRPFVPLVRHLSLLAVSLVLLAFAIVPPTSKLRRRVTMTAVELLWLMVAWNILEYYARIYRGVIHTPFPVPVSLFAGVALIVVWRGAGAGAPGPVCSPGWGCSRLCRMRRIASRDRDGLLRAHRLPIDSDRRGRCHRGIWRSCLSGWFGQRGAARSRSGRGRPIQGTAGPGFRSMNRRD